MSSRTHFITATVIKTIYLSGDLLHHKRLGDDPDCMRMHSHLQYSIETPFIIKIVSAV